MAALWGSEQTESSAPGDPSPAAPGMVVVVRSLKRSASGVSVFRPPKPRYGIEEPHIVLISKYGLTDRDLLRSAWRELAREEREAIAQAFGISSNSVRVVPSGILIPKDPGPGMM
jgi:hypothetical protein